MTGLFTFLRMVETYSTLFAAIAALLYASLRRGFPRRGAFLKGNK